MRKTSFLGALCAIVALAPIPAPAQCGGQGSLVFEVVSVNNTGPLPGSEITLRITGKPNQYVCFACDTGRGPTVLPGIGTLCLDGSVQLLEFAFFLPPSGVLEVNVQLPPDAVPSLVCCQGIGFDPAAPNSVAFSNSICLTIDRPCDSGGFREVGYITKLEDVTSFPVQVTASVEGRAGGSGTPDAEVSYDPSIPPSFPVNQNASVFIENIARIGDDLYVTTLVRSSAALTHNQNGRLPNELDIQVSAGSVVNSHRGLHTSCSQPLAVGMMFGPFTITVATPFRH